MSDHWWAGLIAIGPGLLTATAYAVHRVYGMIQARRRRPISAMDAAARLDDLHWQEPWWVAVSVEADDGGSPYLLARVGPEYPGCLPAEVGAYAVWVEVER